MRLLCACVLIGVVVVVWGRVPGDTIDTNDTNDTMKIEDSVHITHDSMYAVGVCDGRDMRMESNGTDIEVHMYEVGERGEVRRFTDFDTVVGEGGRASVSTHGVGRRCGGGGMYV